MVFKMFSHVLCFVVSRSCGVECVGNQRKEMSVVYIRSTRAELVGFHATQKKEKQN